MKDQQLEINLGFKVRFNIFGKYVYFLHCQLLEKIDTILMSAL